MKKLMIEMLIIVLFASGGGFWVLKEWRKRYPEPIKIEKQVWCKIPIYKTTIYLRFTEGSRINIYYQREYLKNGN